MSSGPALYLSWAGGPGIMDGLMAKEVCVSE